MDPDVVEMTARTQRAISVVVEAIKQYDDGITMFDQMRQLVGRAIARAVEETYDAAFMRGMAEATLDGDGESDEYEIELEDDDEGDA